MRQPLILTVVLGALVSGAGTPLPLTAQAHVALTGRVASAEEGPMEGVVVTAWREGATIAVSVATDGTGRYNFPASTLPEGEYGLKIRAVGYDLVGPAAVDVRPGVTASADIRLARTENLAAQLTNAEWIASMPGSDAQKKFLLSCNSCHSYQPIVDSAHDARQFLQVLERMAGYCPAARCSSRSAWSARRAGISAAARATRWGARPAWAPMREPSPRRNGSRR